LDGPMSQPFVEWKNIRGTLRLTDAYSIPGPIQFDSKGCPTANDIPVSLALELGQKAKPLPTIPAPKPMDKFLSITQKLDSRSELQQWRAKRQHRLPKSLADFSMKGIKVTSGLHAMCSQQSVGLISKYFRSVVAPLVEVEAVAGSESSSISRVSGQRIGVVFSGRQSPGCHDLLHGMADMLKNSPDSQVLGFVGGTKGLFSKQVLHLTPELCASYSGTGGMELLGRTVDRLRSEKEMELARAACIDLKLTGLVLVGGARTNTDAAHLSEHFSAKGTKVSIVGIPCGIEGNMVNEFVEASLGFDSAAKTMAQLCGNIAADGASARKYYYFMRMMDGSDRTDGMPSSHVALEVALQTKPNMLLLTEEVDAKRTSLREVVNSVADVVAKRAEAGKNFGVILVSQGLLAAIPEFRSLITEVEALKASSTREEVLKELTSWSRALFISLPEFMQSQLLLERQSDGGLQISQLETERLLAVFVEDELALRKKLGSYKGGFSPVCQFIGYQSRTSVPSNFDSDYAYALGGTAVALASHGHTGYMATVSDLSSPVEEWRAGGVPFTAMLRVPTAPRFHASRPDSTVKEAIPAILPQCVGLSDTAFCAWKEQRETCATDELFESPGPIQLSGESAARITCTVDSKFGYVREHAKLRKLLDTVSEKCRPGCDPRKVRVASSSLETLNKVLDEL